MGEETRLGYFYPIAVVEDAELEAKILTKRYESTNARGKLFS